MKALTSIIIVFLFTLIVLNSCDNEDGNGSDTIKLSKSVIFFTNEASTETITTDNSFWWIISIKNGEESIRFTNEKGDDYKDFEYSGEWYSIKRDGLELTISTTQNITDKDRNLHIGLQAGNWFGSSISINQKAKQ